MTWLTWKLVGKVAPYVAGILVLIGAVLYLDHQGYQRAEDKFTLEKARDDANQLRLQQYVDQRVGDVQSDLQLVVGEVDVRMHTTLGKLDLEQKTIVQPTLIKEVQSDARFSNPAVGITDGMQSAINTARSASGSACARTPDGGIECSLPPAEPVN